MKIKQLIASVFGRATQQQETQMNDAMQNLTNAITALTVVVDNVTAALASIQTDSNAKVQALAQAVHAQTARLVVALNPPPAPAPVNPSAPAV